MAVVGFSDIFCDAVGVTLPIWHGYSGYSRDPYCRNIYKNKDPLS